MLLFDPELQLIPQSMRMLPQWVNWRYDQQKGKKTKAPYNPHNPSRHASSTNPETWSTLSQALTRTSKYTGLGIVLCPPLIGIDLDHCVDTQGTLSPLAQRVIERFIGTYVEWSPSGQGIHFFLEGVLADIIPQGRKFLHGEIYTEKRFFTVTGHALLESKPAILHATCDDLTWLIKQLGNTQQDAFRINPPSSATPTGELSVLLLDTWFAQDPMMRSIWDITETPHGPLGDTTASAYDMSLARRATNLGATDAEIAKLIEMWRFKHGLKKKGASAVETTIATARTRNIQDAEEAHETETLKNPETLTNEEKQKHALKILKMYIMKIVQRGKNPAMYEVQFLDDEPALFDTVTDFTSAKVWTLLAAERKQATVVMDKTRWLRTQRLLMSMITYEDMPDTQLNSQTENWLRTYVGRKSTRANPGLAWIESGEPFVDVGAQYLTLAHFLTHVHVSCGARHVTLHALAGRLLLLGFKEEMVSRADVNSTATRHYWVRHLQAP